MKIARLALLLAACGHEAATFEPWEIDDLDDAQGFTLRVPTFSVPPGRESQNCYFVQVPNITSGEDIWINRVLVGLNPGSHHMNVFRVKTIKNLRPEDGTPTMLGNYPATVLEGSDDYATHPCWDSANWSDWPLVANSQNSDPDHPLTDWVLPDDVAIRLTPGETLMVQTHYVNSSDQPAEYGAKVGINFYRRSAPAMELGTLFATQQNIRICRSSPRPTFSGTCSFPNAVTITAANGHFHKRGDTFSIFPWDGQSTQHPDVATQFYESRNWDHPPMSTGIELPMPAHTGIWWDCAYRWQEPSAFTCADVDAKDPSPNKDCCYTFGGNTDVGEHCNVFLYYYPKVDTDIFCL
jgi:hypothetical protein